MLNSKQIEEIKEHLERAQNPLFFYDNDADGLCSFLIFRRSIGRGKGIAARSYPDLNSQYAKRAQELNADYIFILDKPSVSKEFLEEIDALHLPVVWIDHHDLQDKELLDRFSNVHYYNSKNGEKLGEPVTYIAYEITDRKEDLWIAVIGCVSDHYMPSFSNEFAKHYPNLWGNVKEPFDVYYKTEIGKIAMALNFGLKDSVTHVVEMQNFLIACKGPEDVFLESDKNKNFRKKYEDIKKKFDLLIERAKEDVFGDLIFFDYAGDTSISSDLSNYLCYLYPEKYIAVAYMKGPISNISLRGKGVKNILEKLIKGFESASGGGHEDAVGARIRTEDLAKFREALEKEVN